MRRKNIFILILIGSVIMLLLILPGIGALEQGEIAFIDSTKAYLIKSEEFKKLNNNNDEIYTEDGIIYESGISDLKVIVQRDNTNDYKSYIKITWKDKSTLIVVNGRIDGIHWRPKHTSFIYVWDVGNTEGGDFVKCTLNYVTLKFSQESLLVENTELSTHEPYTGLAWSSNGKYYVHSVYSSLRIKEFDSGRIWATKTIIFDDGEISIKPNTPTQIGYFKWIDNNKRIIFMWKNHPFDDEPSGYGMLDVGQFRLK